MACIYLGYVSSRVLYRGARLSPKCYFSFASIFSSLLPLSSPLAPYRCSLFPCGFSSPYFRSFIPHAGCYSMPTTPPAFFFISIRVLRAICYHPTNPRWQGMYLPGIIPHSLKLFLRCPLTFVEGGRDSPETSYSLRSYFSRLDTLSRRRNTISIF